MKEFIKEIITFTTKSIIFILLVNFMVCLNLYNIQIQHFDKKHEQITGFTEIVQCNGFFENIQEFIYER